MKRRLDHPLEEEVEELERAERHQRVARAVEDHPVEERQREDLRGRHAVAEEHEPALDLPREQEQVGGLRQEVQRRRLVQVVLDHVRLEEERRTPPLPGHPPPGPGCTLGGGGGTHACPRAPAPPALPVPLPTGSGAARTYVLRGCECVCVYERVCVRKCVWVSVGA